MNHEEHEGPPRGSWAWGALRGLGPDRPSAGWWSSWGGLADGSYFNAEVAEEARRSLRRFAGPLRSGLGIDPARASPARRPGASRAFLRTRASPKDVRAFRVVRGQIFGAEVVARAALKGRNHEPHEKHEQTIGEVWAWRMAHAGLRLRRSPRRAPGPRLYGATFVPLPPRGERLGEGVARRAGRVAPGSD